MKVVQNVVRETEQNILQECVFQFILLLIYNTHLSSYTVHIEININIFIIFLFICTYTNTIHMNLLFTSKKSRHATKCPITWGLTTNCPILKTSTSTECTTQNVSHKNDSQHVSYHTEEKSTCFWITKKGKNVHCFVTAWF